MTSLRPFHASDVFKFNPTNLDPLTETYDLNFYFSYLARWPHLFNVAEGQDGTIDGYSMYFLSFFSIISFRSILLPGFESTPPYIPLSYSFVPSLLVF